MSNCINCKNIYDREISTPSDLDDMLRFLKDKVGLGSLLETAHQDLTACISNGPVRPDIIELSFSCPSCGARFLLWVETYHGYGGSFKRL